MEEIEIGEYVRTNKGNIGKIIDINSEDEYSYDYYCCDNDMGYLHSQIAKHSKNIIDLVEVGDICIMKDITYEFDEFDCVYIYDRSFIEAIKKDVKRGNKIISILTHEQMEANQYVVK